jgi:hypothetical protein
MSITKATGVNPKRIYYYAAAPWKWKVYLKAIEKSVRAKIQQKDLMKELIADPALKAKAEKVAKFAVQIMDEVNRMSEERKQRILQIGIMNEVQTLNEAETWVQIPADPPFQNISVKRYRKSVFFSFCYRVILFYLKIALHFSVFEVYL